jgi:hypothetical protein
VLPGPQRLRSACGQINYICFVILAKNAGIGLLYPAVHVYFNFVPQIVCESIFGVFICYCKGSLGLEIIKSRWGGGLSSRVESVTIIHRYSV